jgi:hypothetical protein
MIFHYQKHTVLNYYGRRTKQLPETQRLIAIGNSLKINFQVIQGHRLARDTSTGLWEAAGATKAQLSSVSAHPRRCPPRQACHMQTHFF